MPGAGAEAAGPQRTGKDAFNGALIMYRRRITLDYSYSPNPQKYQLHCWKERYLPLHTDSG
eukprot:scaffold1505_cov146-Skeletonema_marinoi.AAC.4